MSKNNNLEAIKKSSSNLNKILLILTIIFASLFWAFALYAPIDYTQGQYQINKDNSSYQNITHVQINYNAHMASVNIRFEEDIDYILYSSWKQITSPIFQHDPIEIHFQEILLDNYTLEINVTCSGQGHYESDWNLFYEFEIIIDNSYLIDFNSDVSSANLNIEASNTEFTNFSINSESGSIDVIFHDIYIQTPIEVSIFSGLTDFHIYDSNITSDINFKGDSGVLRIYASDSVFTNINVQTSSGYTDFDGNSNTFKNMSITTSSGSIELDISNSNIENINLTSSSGYIELQMNYINLTGDISISTVSSIVDCEFDEISFSSNRIFDIKVDSGYIEFSWDQEMIMNSSAFIYIETDSGAINVDISTIKANLDAERFVLHVDSQTGYTDVNLYEENYD